MVQEILDGYDQEHLGDRVRAMLIERLPQGEPSQIEFAADAHLGLRTFQRRLVKEGTHFRELLEELRPLTNL